MVQRDRFKLNITETFGLSNLSEPQLIAKEKILKKWKQNSVILFEGVTSSGKTEVYFSTLKNYLNDQPLDLLWYFF